MKRLGWGPPWFRASLKMDKVAWVPGIGLAKGVLAMYVLPQPGLV
jgi:hypothetical protein